VAEGAITMADRLTVQLVRPSDSPHVVLLVWSAAPTATHASPKALANVAAAIVRLMAEAQAQLATIRRDKMIMKVEDFDDKRLDVLHRMRVGQHLAYYMQHSIPTKNSLQGPLEQDELDQLKAMLERNASNDEILLTLHEWADVALDEYAKPVEQCAAGYLTIELDLGARNV